MNVPTQFPRKNVYRTLQEMVDPAHTALLIVDMQKEYIGEGRRKLGLDPTPQQEAAKVIGGLVTVARRRGVLPIFIKNVVSPGGYTLSGVAIANELHVWGAYGVSTEGSEGSQFVEEINYQPGDLIVTKNRNSAFYGTNLDLILRSSAIQTVVVTGQATFACVETTARDALCHDFYVTVVEDAVATVREELNYHQASLQGLRHFLPVCGVATSQEITTLWNSSP
jgi:nicotinamidase-related amidase